MEVILARLPKSSHAVLRELVNDLPQTVYFLSYYASILLCLLYSRLFLNGTANKVHKQLFMGIFGNVVLLLNYKIREYSVVYPLLIANYGLIKSRLFGRFKMIVAFAMNFGVLFAMHCIRMGNAAMADTSRSTDRISFTGTLMVTVVRFIWSVHDVNAGKIDIDSVSLFELWSCVMSLPGLLSGPSFHLSTFREFIGLKELVPRELKDHSRILEKRWRRLRYLITASFAYAIFFSWMNNWYGAAQYKRGLYDGSFIAKPFLQKILIRAFMSLTLHFKYYFAFLASEAAFIAAGAGLHQNHHGKYSWYVVSMIKFMRIGVK